MPYFTFTRNVTAAEVYTPFTPPSPGIAWQFRQPARKALLEVFVNAEAVGCVMSLTTGAESIIQSECPVSAGGTAGVIPARLNTEPAVDEVEPGDELVLAIRNTTGASIDVNGLAVLTYAKA